MSEFSIRHFAFHACHILKKRIRQLLNSYQLIGSDAPVIIAVSGGSDSVALLHLLSSFFPRITRIAVYIDHGLRPKETPAEKKLVSELAAECSADFVSVRVNVLLEQEKSHSSLEEAARNLRYDALETIRSQYKGQCIAVGHTADDQAEEVLLRLIRGSGSAGLGGMAIRNKYIIRPLLQESKENLRNYLKENNIAFCEDSSNTDTRFLRNKIRHHLLPILEQEYNKSMRHSLQQTASILHEEDDLLAKITDTVYQSVISRNARQLVLEIPALCKEHVAIQRRVFEKICWQMAARPSFKHIDSLQKLLHGAINAETHLAKGLRAIKQQNTIIFHHPSKAQGYRGSAIPDKTFPALEINSPGSYAVPELGYKLLVKTCPCSCIQADLKQNDTLLLDARSLNFPLTLRSHKRGETFHPLGAPGTKKIARFLTNQKIPALEKSHYPVILSGNKIIAIAGLRIDNHFRIQDNSRECLQLQWRRTDDSNSLLQSI